MNKPGRPSTSPKKLKDGYYMLITIKNSNKPIRIMRETLKQFEQLKIQYKHHHLEYLGQVKDNLWIDGQYKGQVTNKKY